jgi:cell division protein FtsQ
VRKLARSIRSVILRPSGDSGRKRAVALGFGGQVGGAERFGGGSGVVGENRRRIDPADCVALRRDRRARLVAAAAVVAALALGAGAALGSWRVLTRGDALQLREILFLGLDRVLADDLLALSPVKKGDNLVTADVEAMDRALRRHPWVRAVEIRRRLLPPRLEVRVEERRAMALVELGGLYLVDREAEVFKRAAPGDGLDLPLVTGIARDDYVEKRGGVEPLLSGALALVEGWAAAGLAERQPIQEIHVAEGGTTIYVGERGVEVRLGTGELRQKLARLKDALALLDAGGQRAEVVHLDNRAHPSWVTVRLAGGEAERAASR